MRRHANVVNLDELPAADGPSAGALGARVRWVGAAAGAVKLGCSFTEVEPGKAAWPCHWHAANEEAIVVVEGTGTLRLGEERVEVRAGDYVTLACGVAHQLINSGTGPLRYWCFSTKLDPEVVGYPDSGKVGFSTRAAPGGPVRVLARPEASLSYFDGEPLATKDRVDG
jgi:uncharacterized cupin superfamily protein